jgi:hypothetical protein
MNTDEHVTAGALAPALSGIPSHATHSKSPINRPMLMLVLPIVIIYPYLRGMLPSDGVWAHQAMIPKP